jgi:hypothetical protein
MARVYIRKIYRIKAFFLDLYIYLIYARTTMANKFPADKKAAIAAMLCEGASIRRIEHMTGVHRDTIMRLGVRLGGVCERCPVIARLART